MSGSPAEAASRRSPGAVGRRIDLPGSLASLLALGLAAIWTWWALRRGAYFSPVFHPGAALLAGLLGVLAVATPWPARLRGWPAVALGALFALATWTALSALWSPTPDTAIEDAQRVFAYVAAVGAGLWVCLLLGRRMLLSLMPLALAAGAVGLVTVAAILINGGSEQFLDIDRTLDFPLGYRNANAAFFLIGALSNLGLASREAASPLIRLVAVAGASLGLQLAVLCQSRSSAIALAVAVLVLLFAARSPGRAGLALVAAAIPAAAALPWLLDPFAADTIAAAGEPLRDAAIAIAAASGLAGLLGAGAALLERRRSWGGGPYRWLPSRRWVAAGLAAVAIGVVIAVAVGGGLDERIESFGGGGTPRFEEEGTRFSLNAGSNRRDFWRVSAAAAADRPLLGTGAGGFHAAYLLERDSPETPRDPHSVEMLMLSELGIPGLAFFSLFALGAAVGIIKARRLGPTAMDLSTGALAVGAYWLTQASLDWFWEYPGVTAPVVAVLGAAMAPSLRYPTRGGRWPLRGVVAVAAVLFALTTIPPYLSARWTNAAYERWQDDLPAAYADLERAKEANPLADEPLLAMGVIARESGDSARARAAFEEAIRLEPRNWAGHYFLGAMLIGKDRRSAIIALERAVELNPRDRSAARALSRARRSGRGR